MQSVITGHCTSHIGEGQGQDDGEQQGCKIYFYYSTFICSFVIFKTEHRERVHLDTAANSLEIIIHAGGNSYQYPPACGALSYCLYGFCQEPALVLTAIWNKANPFKFNCGEVLKYCSFSLACINSSLVLARDDIFVCNNTNIFIFFYYS